jgi:hypothetical protein
LESWFFSFFSRLDRSIRLSQERFSAAFLLVFSAILARHVLVGENSKSWHLVVPLARARILQLTNARSLALSLSLRLAVARSRDRRRHTSEIAIARAREREERVVAARARSNGYGNIINAK